MQAGDFHHPIPTKIDGLPGGDMPPAKSSRPAPRGGRPAAAHLLFRGLYGLFAVAFLNRPVADRACRFWRFVAVRPPVFLRISFRTLSTTPLTSSFISPAIKPYSGADV
jgi:hypothetical protein